MVKSLGFNVEPSFLSCVDCWEKLRRMAVIVLAPSFGSEEVSASACRSRALRLASLTRNLIRRSTLRYSIQAVSVPSLTARLYLLLLTPLRYSRCLFQKYLKFFLLGFRAGSQGSSVICLNSEYSCSSSSPVLHDKVWSDFRELRFIELLSFIRVYRIRPFSLWNTRYIQLVGGTMHHLGTHRQMITASIPRAVHHRESGGINFFGKMRSTVLFPL